jgi:hypothetical protein
MVQRNRVSVTKRTHDFERVRNGVSCDTRCDVRNRHRSQRVEHSIGKRNSRSDRQRAFVSETMSVDVTVERVDTLRDADKLSLDEFEDPCA